MKHVLLRNPRLTGIEYGMLRYLEHEIVRQTLAEVIDVPKYKHPLKSRMGHGMRLSPLRKVLPKKKFIIEADVLWYVLMGPENYELDLFEQWEIHAKHRIVYLFDTLEPQFTLTKKLFSASNFTIRITSFNDAAPHLEKLTGHRWQVIEQAVPENIFFPAPDTKRIIDFSSYGRRLDTFHEIIKEYCEKNNFYYDFSTQNGRHLAASQEEAYQQYAWHLSHSIFSISWPVELTNPQRAGQLHPITCRWFEGAAAGTIMIGKKPGNPIFDTWLSSGLIHNISLEKDKIQIWKQLDNLYSQRTELLDQKAELALKNKARWTWTERVHRMLEVIQKEDKSGSKGSAVNRFADKI